MTTRARILEHLERNSPATTDELARALKIPPANVRHHLRVLVDEDVIEIVSERPLQGRGRPACLYSLTSQASRHNLDTLAGALLEVFIESQPQAAQGELLRRIAGKLVQPVDATTLARRLTQAVRRLNELNYQAHWEAHSQAPRLVLGHCPYAAILPEHPELCQLDSYLIETLVSVPARQSKKLAVDSRGMRYCMFTVGEK
jgi:predicted ArsR family transcriptional regulator